MMLVMCACTLTASAQTVEEQVRNLQNDVNQLKGQIEALQENVEKVLAENRAIKKDAHIGEVKAEATHRGLEFKVTKVTGYKNTGEIWVEMVIYNPGPDIKVSFTDFDNKITTLTQQIRSARTNNISIGGQKGVWLETIPNENTVKVEMKFTDILGTPEYLQSFTPVAMFGKDSNHETIATFKNIKIDWEE